MSNDTPSRSREELRRELAETLNALEYRLDVPARVGEWADERKAQFLRAKDENPTRVYGLLGGAVLGLVGIVAGAIVLANRKR
ncbi:DUF3618 domain-containing protein [Gulosibacter sp. ACHW.36C]|uniref:DUF3618 domain-containing protein n=1 Tax=Gulosibacter sediminis TaxID=1729695 RepID=A0ABY4MY96_9MICO|nr:DUF3618 domain-containing protein [Gulosibacter sediminis]UQN14680.1 DUF3618 domain-containing protein [Gulosibacter sediminis]